MWECRQAHVHRYQRAQMVKTVFCQRNQKIPQFYIHKMMWPGGIWGKGKGYELIPHHRMRGLTWDQRTAPASARAKRYVVVSSPFFIRVGLFFCFGMSPLPTAKVGPQAAFPTAQSGTRPATVRWLAQRPASMAFDWQICPPSGISTRQTGHLTANGPVSCLPTSELGFRLANLAPSWRTRVPMYVYDPWGTFLFRFRRQQNVLGHRTLCPMIDIGSGPERGGTPSGCWVNRVF